MSYKIIEWVIWYFFCGAVNLKIVDYAINKVVELMNNPETRGLTITEKLVFLIIWPIPTIAFWVSFMKSFFSKD